MRTKVRLEATYNDLPHDFNSAVPDLDLSSSLVLNALDVKEGCTLFEKRAGKKVLLEIYLDSANNIVAPITSAATTN